tara:strand:+ start:125 stop:760 length:636 start_codon:yes stop_codon:yes gene_type:complete
MKKINLKYIFFFLIFCNFFFLNLQSKINNNIVVKVGELLITSLDIQNEIITNLMINDQEITQVNINNGKNYAIKNLISKSIKRGEIKKYQIQNYSKKDLKNYIENTAKKLNTNNLKIKFKQFGVSYEEFVKNYETELLWNTLIFELYRNQTNINIMDVDREVEKRKKNKNVDELKIIKQNLLDKKKEEKFNLFSRSHFSNLENTVTIKFNE